jgi:hypothetical protein
VVQIVRDAALVANVLEHMRQVPADAAQRAHVKGDGQKPAGGLG